MLVCGVQAQETVTGAFQNEPCWGVAGGVLKLGGKWGETHCAGARPGIPGAPKMPLLPLQSERFAPAN